MFFMAAFTSGAEFSWLDSADFFCGLAKADAAFANTIDAAISEIVLVGTIFVTKRAIPVVECGFDLS
jgi:hypothetical protein